ncbi:hypothetical protein [Aridibaculum aurantiacum]|uniref:hypothetical protein n=1 Tax=Aridibaculum aurantiacum TaxID=2810307 RepID=UPI001A958EBF|nr:hypothetical protein [Aridibaculum aurantiacum]
MKILNEISFKRVLEVRFKPEERKIIFTIRTLFSDQLQKVYSLDDLRLEVVESKPVIFGLSQPVALYFLRNRKEVCELTNSKDGFSNEQLQEIYKTAETLSLPVKKV